MMCLTLFGYFFIAHYKTHGAWKSYPGLAIYMIYFCTPEVGKSFPSCPFMWDILYSLKLENHTVVYTFMRDILYSKKMNFNPIHPLNISYSSFKWWYLSNEFHTHFDHYHISDFIRLVSISSYNSVKLNSKLNSQGSFFSQQVY